MPGREEMLALLKGLEKPVVEELGSCIAGRDVQVATREGVGTRCIQDESTGPVGPFSFDSDTRDRIRHLLETDRTALEAECDEDEEFPDLVGMVLAGCKPDTWYYRLATTPMEGLSSVLEKGAIGSWIFYSEDEEELEDRHAEDLAQCLDDFEEWDEMDDEALEGWIADLGLEAPKAKAG